MVKAKKKKRTENKSSLVGRKAECYCLISIIESDIFKGDHFFESNVEYDATDLICSLKDDTGKKFHVQVKSRKPKIVKKENMIVYPKAIKKKDIVYMGERDVPFIIALVDSSKSLINENVQIHYINTNDYIKYLNNNKRPNWKTNYSEKTQFEVKIPLDQVFSIENFKEIKKWVEEKYTFPKPIPEIESIHQELKEIKYLIKKITTQPKAISKYKYTEQEEQDYLFSLANNQHVIDANKQINDEYMNRSILKNFIMEKQYDENIDKDMPLSMFAQHIQLPKSFFEEDHIMTMYYDFGFAILNSELNSLFEVLMNEKDVEKIKIKDFELSKIKDIIYEAKFDVTTIIFPQDLYVTFFDTFRNETDYDYKLHKEFWTFNDKSIRIEFVLNDYAKNKILILQKESIQFIYKTAKQTNKIKDIDKAIPLGNREKRLDFRVYHKIDDVFLIIRSVGGFNIVKPENIRIIDFEIDD